MYKNDVPPLPDCPCCGKKGGAYMSSSSWGHDISCCSEECGKKIKNQLEANKNSPAYKNALTDYYIAEEKVMELKYKDIDAIGLADQIGDRNSW